MFASFEPARLAHLGGRPAHAMVETIDRVLDELGFAGDREVG